MNDLILRFKTQPDLHQSPMYGDLMRTIGWHVVKHAESQIFYRPLGPLTIVKIQRPQSLDLDWLKSFRQTHHALTTYIEPSLASNLPEKKFGLSVEPFAHSCTSLLDLLPTEQNILNAFSQKTRYNIVRSLKKSELKIITIELGKLTKQQLADFFALHHSWSKQKNVIGYSVELLSAMIKAFAKSGDLHLAYVGDQLVATLMIPYHNSIATYWAAFASPLGYKSYAPTLLTWVAIQTAKSKKCEIFDFGGIYDPRYPKMYKNWHGFTKFKAGFKPTVVSYPQTILQLFW